MRLYVDYAKTTKEIYGLAHSTELVNSISKTRYSPIIIVKTDFKETNLPEEPHTKRQTEK